jgi:hypothetical protein
MSENHSIILILSVNFRQTNGINRLKIGTKNIKIFLILTMKYGAISIKYISYFLKINME